MQIKNAIINKIRAVFYWWHFSRIQAVQNSPQKSFTLAQNQANLFFITGFDKSGTTWLMRLVNDHPEIYCHAAGQFFNFHIPGVHFLNQPGGYQTMAQDIINSNWYKASGHIWIPEASIYMMSKQLIVNSMWQFKQEKQNMVGDKSTVQDCTLIRKLFPEAPILAIMRDGRDIAVSFAYHFLRRGNATKFAEVGKLDSDYLQAVSYSWSRYNEHLLDFAASDDANFYLIKYEELLAETNSRLRDIFAFLNLPTDSNLTEKIAKNNSFNNLSGGRDPGQADEYSFFRKGIVGDWKNYFDERDLDIFMQNAGDTLRRAGFYD